MSRGLQEKSNVGLRAPIESPTPGPAPLGLMGMMGNAATADALGLSGSNRAPAASTYSGDSSAATSSVTSSGSLSTGSGSAGTASTGSGGGVLDWIIGENGGAAWGEIWDCITGDEQLVPGPTGGLLPPSLADEMNVVRNMVPADAHENGMHAWHAGTNAMLAEKLGIVGAPLIFLGGLFHESPLDWASFQAEQECQGTVNHALDSTMDIVSNVVGMGMGYFDTSGNAVQNAIDVGNDIPGPGETDPAFNGGGCYDGNPSHAW